jgi:hypothetical protein
MLDGRRPAPARRGLHRILLAIVSTVVLAAGATACGGSTAETQKTTTTVTRAPAAGASVSELTRLSGSLGRPVFWAGPKPGNTYELSRTKDGRVFIRYLPSGVKSGDPRPNFLSVGTYPQAKAFATLKATAKKQGEQTIAVRGGGLAFVDRTHPTSVYVAYPGSDYQIEVYDPSPARSRQLVVSGKLVPLGVPTPGRAPARALSPAQLKSLASDVGHPIYWAGTEPKTTYEVTKTSEGRIYVRYLPPGVKVGDARPDYLTVGTYPQTGALAKLKAAAAKTHAETIDLAGGGFASIDKSKPTSVYVAYPKVNLQIEAYDPKPARVRALVTSGRLAPVG